MIKKILLLLILVVCLSGCEKENLNGKSITNKEFSIGGEKIIVGGEQMLGADQTKKFKPEVKLTKWNEEENLTVSVTDDMEDKAIQIGDKTISKSKDGKREYHFYTKTAEEIGSNTAGFEYELILNEKPKTNVFTWKLDGWEDLDFFYQPALTEDEIKDGKNRKENIVGSYAVYHKTKNNNKYKAGKLFHIYRPKITDTNGVWIWGELNIKDGVLTVTVDKQWLNKAKYPVSVDPTFGYTTVGGSYFGYSANRWVGSLFTSPSDIGTVSSFTVHCDNTNNGSIGQLKSTAVLNAGLTIVSNGIGTAASVADSVSWITSSFSTDPTFSQSTGYLLSIVIGDNTVNISYDTGDANQGAYESDNNFASPTDPANVSLTNEKYSIYATYEVSGSPPEEEPQKLIQIITF